MDVVSCFHDVVWPEELVSHVRVNGVGLAVPGYLLFHVGGGGVLVLITVFFVGLSWFTST